MLAGTRDGQQIEQFEVIESEHFEQMRGRPIIFEREPAVELELGLSRGGLDAGSLFPASAVSSPSVTKAIWF